MKLTLNETVLRKDEGKTRTRAINIFLVKKQGWVCGENLVGFAVNA